VGSLWALADGHIWAHANPSGHTGGRHIDTTFWTGQRHRDLFNQASKWRVEHSVPRFAVVGLALWYCSKAIRRDLDKPQ